MRQPSEMGVRRTLLGSSDVGKFVLLNKSNICMPQYIVLKIRDDEWEWLQLGL